MESGLFVGFLIEIGRWAKSELSERWKLRREQQTAEMTSKTEVEAQAPAQLETEYLRGSGEIFLRDHDLMSAPSITNATLNP